MTDLTLVSMWVIWALAPDADQAAGSTAEIMFGLQ